MSKTPPRLSPPPVRQARGAVRRRPVDADDPAVAASGKYASVRRNLFGTVDSDDFIRECAAERERELEEKRRRWNFDFDRGEPLAGSYDWERCPTPPSKGVEAMRRFSDMFTTTAVGSAAIAAAMASARRAGVNADTGTAAAAEAAATTTVATSSSRQLSSSPSPASMTPPLHPMFTRRRSTSRSVVGDTPHHLRTSTSPTTPTTPTTRTLTTPPALMTTPTTTTTTTTTTSTLLDNFDVSTHSPQPSRRSTPRTSPSPRRPPPRDRDLASYFDARMDTRTSPDKRTPGGRVLKRSRKKV